MLHILLHGMYSQYKRQHSPTAQKLQALHKLSRAVSESTSGSEPEPVERERKRKRKSKGEKVKKKRKHEKRSKEKKQSKTKRREQPGVSQSLQVLFNFVPELDSCWASCSVLELHSSTTYI